MDVWYLDDGTIVTTPELAVAYLKAYDHVTEKQGGKRNPVKTVTTLLARPQPVSLPQAMRSLPMLPEFM